MKTYQVLSVAALAAVALTATVRAGGDKVVFPENYAKGVLYTTVDRADNKQYRELYSTPEAIAALKAGQPIPSGTVLTLVPTRPSSPRTATRRRTPTAASSRPTKSCSSA